ncbi:MAG: hypothetical protein PWQ67_1312 [Clostridia bacterium]|jgi:hypothetical protein|nr:hypothetical protein [Clostridia bacterium]MDN5322858.1 hypothetical protein [Clostridia bacterium]
MKKELKLLVILMSILILLTSTSVSYASSDDIITLEEAKELTKNSRTLKQYELDLEKAKYEYYQAKDEYDDAKTPSYYNLLPYYFYLTEREAQGEDVTEQLKMVESQISAAKEKLDSEIEKAASLKDKVQDSENRYEDSKKELEKYKQELDYLVEQLYITILKQEDRLKSLQEEYDLKLNLLNVERKKLELGRSTQEEVNKLAVEGSNLNKTIVETNNSIKNLKGKLNDMMGRDYNCTLVLEHFDVPEVTAVPAFTTLLSQVTQEYIILNQIERDIEKKKDDLDDDNVEDVEYQADLINIEIKEKELQLEDEKYKLNETINNLITDLKIKQKNYQLAKIDLTNAQKRYEWDQKRFEIGRISKLDLHKSELNYINTKNEAISAGYDFYLAQHKLELAEKGVLVN